MHGYRNSRTDFGVVYAAPALGVNGCITKCTLLILQHAAKMFKEGRIHGVSVVGAYSNHGGTFVTNDMQKVLVENDVPESAVIQVPFRVGSSPLDALMEKFSIAQEYDEAPRSSNVELTFVVPSSIAEFFCIKTVNSKGIRVRGYPEEVDVPFNIMGFVQNVRYILGDCIARV